LLLAATKHVAGWTIDQHDERIELAGDLQLADAPRIWRALHTVARESRADVVFDVSRVATIDGTVMSLLVDLRASLSARGVRCEIVGGSRGVREIVHLFGGDQIAPVQPRALRSGPITRLGIATERMLRRTQALISFGGDVVASWLQPWRLNARSLPNLIARAGADGIVIVLVLNFLVGFVMAYQSMEQLKLYGANLYVADIVGISVTRELAPLMTAIIMAGRSGAGFAAELGTMRVSEEIDALRTLGFAPMPYLVLPRIIALALVAPVLTLLGDVVGVVGGMVVGATSLDVSPSAYINELRITLVRSDVWTGLVKSVGFGLAIAFIGCQQGLTASGAASGVGRGTTATVVRCLFSIVIIDTLFTVVFRGFDL
jgi:phospholipid/cholesterol/gamma-HCH transport system permease protein